MLGTGKKGVLRSTQIYVEKSFLQDNLYFFIKLSIYFAFEAIRRTS